MFSFERRPDSLKNNKKVVEIKTIKYKTERQVHMFYESVRIDSTTFEKERSEFK